MTSRGKKWYSETAPATVSMLALVVILEMQHKDINAAVTLTSADDMSMFLN